MRKDINAIVRNYAKENGGCYAETWNKLYKEMAFYIGADVKEMAKIQKIKTLDLIEKLGKLATLFALARLMFS